MGGSRYYNEKYLLTYFLVFLRRSRFVKIVAIAVVKPSGGYDVVDVEVHQWKPSQGGGARGARRSRGGVKSRSWTGAAGTTTTRSSGAMVAAGRARASGQGWNAFGNQRHLEDVEQTNNNNNREDGTTFHV